MNGSEAQCATTSQLRGEAAPGAELNFTPGIFFHLKLNGRLLF
jgi:hypothetical protein